MFAQFPVKPRSPAPSVPIHNNLKSPKPLKREHRVARIYEPRSPTLLPSVPLPARTQPDRPAPILSLPGLPPRTLPKTVITPRRTGFGFGEGWIKSGKTWLAQLRPPWVRAPEDPTTPSIPPVTPRTAKFINESRYYTPKDPKFLDAYGNPLSDEGDYNRDPPPLYKKHAPEGGIKGWSSVAGAFLIQFCTIGYLFTWNVFEEHYNHVVLTDQNPIAVRLFLLSFVGEEQIGKIFACQSLGMGIGMGLVFVPTAIIPLHYFKRRRGLAVGIVMSGGSFGGMIFPAVLRILIPTRGIGGAVRITAFIILPLLVIANGLLGFSIPLKEEKPAYPLPRLDIAKYSKEMEYLFAAGGAFLTMLVIYYPAMYLSLLGLEHGVDPKSAFTSVSIKSLSYRFFLTILPKISQGPKSLVAVSIFYGIFSGAWLSLLITALSTLASRMSETGTRIGLVLSISSFGLLFSALIQDGMLTPKHIWAIPSAVSGILLIGVTALAYFSRTFLAAKKPAGTRRRAKIQGIQVLKRFQLL
ncbi:hypothetical protein M413DRAFT_26030 [Hebeloma cylindrosporum]|uniref:Major facilitator superfamily (MFS) profile domain-containing protein n=1 Tax=Hebeloma cylindrosporum TaxID=76867 RepID=A0A0C2Y1J4_HEBCY|nr:hypothetical protein M413DRAFT_26030 [Hebeloma cylindrosporum h7]